VIGPACVAGRRAPSRRRTLPTAGAFFQFQRPHPAGTTMEIAYGWMIDSMGRGEVIGSA
jgi:hypothetical protein